MKFSIASPFKCPWPQLIQEWSDVSAPADQGFYVLRTKSSLVQIEDILNGKGKRLPDMDDNCLIPVSMVLNGRGNANNFSIICLPKKRDFKLNLANRKQFINSPALIEATAADKNESERKQLRLKHLMMLKRLRRQRVRVKRKKQEYSERKVLIAPPRTAHLINTQYKRMCELWLPSTPKSIRQQCSREVFGYLTQSQFMFHEAKVSGIGYITVNGLRKLLKLKDGRRPNQVLVRDPNSLNYRFATITVRC